MFEFLSALLPGLLEAIGGGSGAAGGGGILSSLFSAGSSAPALALPAASATPGIANASGDFLSSVGLPGYGAGGATAAGNAAAGGTDWGDVLKSGGNFLGGAGQLMQAMKKSPSMTQPAQPSAPAAPAPPVNFGSTGSSGGGSDPYASALQKLLQQHGNGMYGGGY